MGALDGLKVIDLSRLFPGPFCTTLLADHGAEVIVVEAPHFRDESVITLTPMVRRNKRHVALDLKHEDGRAVFFRMLAGADVLMQGFRPGVAERLGVGYETVREVNPRIIYCSLTGYGQDGPLAFQAGHDMNYMAASGMLDLVTDASGRPIVPKFQISHLTGSLYAALGILLALASREKTGQGQYIDAAMTDGLVTLLALPMAHIFAGTTLPGRFDNDAPDGWFACYRVYETADGRYLSVGPLEPHLWAILCEKLGCPEFIDLQYDIAAQGDIISGLEKIFQGKTLAEWLALLDGPDACIAPVTRVDELLQVPHVQARRLIHQPTGGVPEPGIVPKLSLTPGALRMPAYRFGQHTREVLSEMGYSGEEIADLAERGVAWTRPSRDEENR